MLFEPEYDTRPRINADRLGSDPHNGACFRRQVHASSSDSYEAQAAYRRRDWYICQRMSFCRGHNLAMVVVWTA